MKNNVIKFFTGISYLWLVRLTWLWIHGQLDWQFASGCLMISGLWLGLTVINLGKRLQAFYDNLARLSVLLPLWLGIGIALTGLLSAHTLTLQVMACTLIAGWGGVYLFYKQTRAKYVKAGHGLLPAGAWINVPPEAYQDGDITLTAGSVATDLKNSVGHGEVTVVDYSGAQPEFYSFSSYMGTGAIINKLTDIANPSRESGLYIVLRPVHPLTEAQKSCGFQLAKTMCEQNVVWRDRTQAGVTWLFDHLPFNKTAFMIKLRQKFHVSGYDWLGLATGRVAVDHWICIVAALEHSRRRGIRTDKYDRGALGLGTGWFDATNPDYVLSDRHYRLLTVADQGVWVAATENRARIAGSAP